MLPIIEACPATLASRPTGKAMPIPSTAYGDAAETKLGRAEKAFFVPHRRHIVSGTAAAVKGSDGDDIERLCPQDSN